MVFKQIGWGEGMKIIEVAEEVKQTLGILEEIRETRSYGCDLEMQIESENIKLEALEKQIPKKPNRFDGYFCGNCNGRLARQTDLIYQKYCHHCGQKIDWGKSNVQEI